jgi:Tol biopolymer transport system component
MHRHEDIGGDVYITEPSGTESRLTFEPARENSSPIWSPDGQYVVYGARKDAKFGLFRRLADSRGTEELLYESDRLVTPMSWSRDGKRLVFTVRVSESNSDLWVLTLESADGAVSTSEKPQAFASSPADETHGQISNDGHWLAYASNEKDPAVYEVYVRPFPAGAGKRQISIAGGRWPRWSRDGKELLFMLNVPDNQTSETGSLRRVTFSVKGDAFVHEPEQEFLRFRALNLSHPGGDFPTYAVGDKGTVYVFSLVTPPAAATSTVVAPDQETGNTVLHYWQPHLRKK